MKIKKVTAECRLFYAVAPFLPSMSLLFNVRNLHGSTYAAVEHRLLWHSGHSDWEAAR
jgi:hypothetical protein